MATMLPDADEMKKQVRHAAKKNVYNVHDYYYDHGFCQSAAKNTRLEHLTLTVIVLNALYIAVDIDHNDSTSLHKAHFIFQLLENVFCTYFTIELLLRFGAFKHKQNCLKDAWFVFDSLLVLAMIFETWIMGYLLPALGVSLTSGVGGSGILRLLRIMRVSRMSRTARLLRSVPELMILLKGIVSASSSCCWTATLLIIVMFVWSLMMKQLTLDTALGRQHFPDIPNGMYKLMITGCFMKGFDLLLNQMKEDSIIVFIAYLLFVLFCGVAIMKMLTGMICKVIVAVAASETEKISVGFVRQELLEALLELGHAEGDNHQQVDIESLKVSKEMFAEMLTSHRVLNALHKLGVDVVALVTFSDFIFPLAEEDDIFPESESESPTPDKYSKIKMRMSVKQRRSQKNEGERLTCPFPDLMEDILQLRGSNPATVKDMIFLQKFIRAEVRTMEGNLARYFQEHEHHLKSVVAKLTHNRDAGSSASAGVGKAPAEVVFDNLCRLHSPLQEADAENNAPTPSSSELKTLKNCELREIAVDGGAEMQSVDDALEAANVKQALIDLILSNINTQEERSSDVEVCTRVVAAKDIYYKGGDVVVPKGTRGSVIAQSSRLQVDWDSFSTFEYMKCMLDYTQVQADQIEVLQAQLEIKAGIHVIVASEFENGRGEVYLRKGQHGYVIYVDGAGHAWVDFFKAGKHWIYKQNFTKLKRKDERARFFHLLADSSRQGYLSKQGSSDHQILRSQKSDHQLSFKVDNFFSNGSDERGHISLKL